MKLRYLFTALCLCLLLVSPAAAAGGSGTEAYPYIIETAAELQSIQNDLTAYYQLAADIDLASVSWTPIGSQSSPFIGSFNGNGKIIKNLYLSTSNPSGLFGCISSGAVIKDVTFQDCTIISSSSWCGVAIGSVIMSSSAHNTALISNVDCIRCSVISSGDSVGTLVGLIYLYADVNIIDCDVSNSYTEGSYGVSCFTGRFNYALSIEITNCNVLYSHAYALSYGVGCLIGEIYTGSSYVIETTNIHNSIAESNGNSISCFVGRCSGNTVSVNVLNSNALNCIVKGANYAGGIIGSCSSGVTTQTCLISGCSIVVNTNYAGGIAGVNPATSSNFNSCIVSDCTILATSYAAAICPAFS